MKYELIFLIAVIFLCYLQTLLSEKESPIPGLILPTLLFVLSVVVTAVLSSRAQDGTAARAVFTMVFLNIPTLVLLLIYRLKQKNIKK